MNVDYRLVPLHDGAVIVEHRQDLGDGEEGPWASVAVFPTRAAGWEYLDDVSRRQAALLSGDPPR